MKQQAHIGKIAAEKNVVIESGMVERFVDALGITDPLCTDPAAATRAGLPGLLLPAVAVSAFGDYDAVIQLLELKPKQVLHSGENFSVFKPLCVGQKLHITTTLRELYEQQVSGNPMGFATIDVVGKGPDGVPVFDAQRIIAIRGGFPRR